MFYKKKCGIFFIFTNINYVKLQYIIYIYSQYNYMKTVYFTSDSS